MHIIGQAHKTKNCDFGERGLERGMRRIQKPALAAGAALLGARAVEPASWRFGVASALLTQTAASLQLPDWSNSVPTKASNGPRPPCGQPRSGLRGCCLQAPLCVSPPPALEQILRAPHEAPQPCCHSRIFLQVLPPWLAPPLAWGFLLGAIPEIPLVQGSQ